MNKFQTTDCVLVTDQKPPTKGKVVSVRLPSTKSGIILYEVKADEWQYPSFIPESHLQYCEDEK